MNRETAVERRPAVDASAAVTDDPDVPTAHGRVVTIDSGHDTPNDKSTVGRTLPEKTWERLSDQRDTMIAAMTSLFKWLNGGVYALVVAAWLVGIWWPDYRIVDSRTLMALIGATVVQAGIAFVAITRFLFPGAKSGTGVT